MRVCASRRHIMKKKQMGSSQREIRSPGGCRSDLVAPGRAARARHHQRGLERRKVAGPHVAHGRVVDGRRGGGEILATAAAEAVQVVVPVSMRAGGLEMMFNELLTELRRRFMARIQSSERCMR